MNGSAQPTNIFAMFQKNTNCYYPCVRIDFTEIKDHPESNAKGEVVFKKIIPSYNNDGHYFTDAFVLQSQNARKTLSCIKDSSPMDMEETKEKFQSRIQKQNDNMDIQEIFQAQPDSYFCQICRSDFENYQDHIEGKGHIRNLEFSKGHKFIKQICKQAKKYCQSNLNEEDRVQAKEPKKNKSIQCKKISTSKSKKKEAQQDKMVSVNHTIPNTETKCCEHDQGSIFKREKNESNYQQLKNLKYKIQSEKDYKDLEILQLFKRLFKELENKFLAFMALLESHKIYSVKNLTIILRAQGILLNFILIYLYGFINQPLTLQQSQIINFTNLNS